jgi:hypothetical protein
VTALEEKQFMIKKCIFYSFIALTVGFISQGFRPLESKDEQWFFIEENQSNPQIFPSEEVTEYVTSFTPLAGKSFTGYKEALAFKESQGLYKLVNSLGYMGKYQFGKTSLKAIGIKNSSRFLESPDLQEKAFIALLSLNKAVLKNQITKFSGKTINGIKITESGILAAAHLGGAGSVKKFFSSNGKQIRRDAFGTSIVSYMRRFGGYDTDWIAADLNARI